MRFLLMDIGCWSIIDGIKPKLKETSTRRERSEYKQRQDYAFSTIYYGVDDQHKTLISSLNDVAEAWKLLQDKLEPKSRTSVIRLLDEFFSIHLMFTRTLLLYSYQESVNMSMDGCCTSRRYVPCVSIDKDTPT
ncbi:uncharacterized protein CEXT_544991 [Caerostris extrusa]|uniref:Uncharacterized protein n=1 Tax=Caerostris extrusa TaxID=172846 RepID=A0AAV4X2M8_CAEEX|nr:uncharacterized protein CEXT_544991 [Caerostris extrusa]